MVLHGLVAQRLAQGTHNPWVLGSNPGGPTRKTAGQTMCLAFCIKKGHPAMPHWAQRYVARYLA